MAMQALTMERIMDWLRLHHGTCVDAKWRIVSKRAGQSTAVVIAVWIAMLERASQNNPRGSIIGWSDEDVAAVLDLDQSQVRAVRDAMQGKTLDGDVLTGWDRRQPKREDGSAERARAWRERNRTQPNADVTHENASERISNATERTRTPERREREKERENTTTSSACVSAQGSSGVWEAVRDRYWDSIASVFGDECRPGWPAATDRVTVQRWLDAGATPDLIADVTHDHLSRMAARNRAPPRSMACFDQDIADAIATAKKPLEAANARQSPRSSAHRPPHSRASSDQEVRAALAAAVADRMGPA